MQGGCIRLAQDFWRGVIYKFTENPMKKEDERPSFTGCYNLFLYF